MVFLKEGRQSSAECSPRRRRRANERSSACGQTSSPGAPTTRGTRRRPSSSWRACCSSSTWARTCPCSSRSDGSSRARTARHLSTRASSPSTWWGGSGGRACGPSASSARSTLLHRLLDALSMQRRLDGLSAGRRSAGDSSRHRRRGSRHGRWSRHRGSCRLA